MSNSLGIGLPVGLSGTAWTRNVSSLGRLLCLIPASVSRNAVGSIKGAQKLHLQQR